jgi:Protein of unknwon function (DUF3008)
MGAALAAKRGASTFPAAQKIAGQMSEKQLTDFAKGPVRGSVARQGEAPKQRKSKTYL